MRPGILTPTATWTVVALAAATLALGGCGRKGGLDLPPTTTAQPMANAAPSGDPDSQSSASRGAALFTAPGAGEDASAAPRGSERGKRSFLLDPLLGN